MFETETVEDMEGNQIPVSNASDSLAVVQIFMLGIVIGLLVFSHLSRRWHT